MDRNNESLTSKRTTATDKTTSHALENRFPSKNETAHNENREDEYPDWKEGYLAEIYLTQRNGDDF